MNVYINKNLINDIEYGAGCIIVAANSIEEANDIIQNYSDFAPNSNSHIDGSLIDLTFTRQIKDLECSGSVPCFIDGEFYIE